MEPWIPGENLIRALAADGDDVFLFNLAAEIQKGGVDVCHTRQILCDHRVRQQIHKPVVGTDKRGVVGAEQRSDLFRPRLVAVGLVTVRLKIRVVAAVFKRVCCKTLPVRTQLARGERGDHARIQTA